VFAVGLAALKFLLLPWVEIQNESRLALEVLTQRLDRSIGVIQNRERIIKSEGELREADLKNFERFPTFSSLESMKLDAQVKIGGVAQSHDLRAGLFEWVLSGDATEAG
jgi:hypothetical protein